MGCHVSKTAPVAGEPQAPREQPSGEDPGLGAGPEAQAGNDTPVKDGTPEPQS
uniref:Uncharacterized protein n=1 Tax=Pipistrellus kuhlii TaxID=59472 RepID=A0A7J7UYX1_PIPKU|nr:hypothetical protein mPipKuh1_000116 [Pipistrellus kuhlii]